MEITKEQEALMRLIVDAYNKHQIPQDVTKKLVYVQPDTELLS